MPLEWKPTPRQEQFISLPDAVKEALYGGAAGGGKDLDLNSIIFTQNGVKRFEDVHPGDYVFDPEGWPTRVVAESEIFTDHVCYELSFSNGTKIIAGEGHLWRVLDLKDRENAYKRTEEYRARKRELRAANKKYGTKRIDLVLRNQSRHHDLKPQFTDKLVTTKTLFDNQIVRRRVNFSIDCPKEVNTLTSKLPLDPYILGCWLGDGNSYAGVITNIDSQVVDYFIAEFGIPAKYNNEAWGIYGLQTKLREIGVFKNKHIPQIYLTASYDQRLDLLRGLMDTDGTCNSDGQVEISQCREDLAEQIALLIRTLGDNVRVNEDTSFLYGIQKQNRYRIKWIPSFICFNLDRKRNNQVKFKERVTTERIYINEVKKVSTVPTKCIQVDSSDGMFLIGEGLIPTHNSEVLLYLPLVRQFYQHPKFKGIILRRTLPELERELIQRSKVDGFYKACGGIYKEQKKVWEFPSGARVEFGHVEHEKDVEIYDTAQYNYIGWDEATSFTEYQYEYLSFSRCRSSSIDLPSIVRAGTNPGGVSHGYFRRRFVGKTRDEAIFRANKIVKEIVKRGDKEFESYLAFIPSKLQDNPHLLKSDPNYINDIQRLPEVVRIAKADGDWWIYAGQMFDDFRDHHIESEPDNAIHVIKPFEIPYYWPRVLSIDWGGGTKTSAMTHALWTAINPNPSEFYPAKFYSYREFTAVGEKVSNWASHISKLSGGENLVDVALDPSAFGDRGTEHTIAEEFAKHFGREARRADNDRLAGAVIISEYLRWKPLPAKYVPPEGYNQDVATRIRRIQGEQALKDYESLFILDDVQEFLPKYQIFEDTCPKLIEAIQNCSKDPEKPGDIIPFKGDDPYDNLRYNLSACLNYLNSGQQFAANEAERARVLDYFHRTGNYNALETGMNRLEKRERVLNSPVPMRRYMRLRRRYA